jgi:hypothetical protein
MPKVTRKETSQPLQQSVAAMAVDDEAELPLKPNFSALSAQEQQKGKVEFRRVRAVFCCFHHAQHAMPTAHLTGYVCFRFCCCWCRDRNLTSNDRYPCLRTA